MAALVITAIVARRPGTPNLPFALVVLLGIAAYIAWELWRFFTGRFPRDAPEFAGRVAFALFGATSVALALSEEGTAPWSWAAALAWIAAFTAIVAAGAWAVWRDVRRRR